MRINKTALVLFFALIGIGGIFWWFTWGIQRSDLLFEVKSDMPNYVFSLHRSELIDSYAGKWLVNSKGVTLRDSNRVRKPKIVKPKGIVFLFTNTVQDWNAVYSNNQELLTAASDSYDENNGILTVKIYLSAKYIFGKTTNDIEKIATRTMVSNLYYLTHPESTSLAENENLELTNYIKNNATAIKVDPR